MYTVRSTTTWACRGFEYQLDTPGGHSHRPVVSAKRGGVLGKWTVWPGLCNLAPGEWRWSLSTVMTICKISLSRRKGVGKSTLSAFSFGKVSYYYYQRKHTYIYHKWVRLTTALARKVMQSASSIRPSVRLPICPSVRFFPLTFELSDLWRLSFACARVMTISCLGLEPKVTSPQQIKTHRSNWVSATAYRRGTVKRCWKQIGNKTIFCKSQHGLSPPSWIFNKLSCHLDKILQDNAKCQSE